MHGIAYNHMCCASLECLMDDVRNRYVLECSTHAFPLSCVCVLCVCLADQLESDFKLSLDNAFTKSVETNTTTSTSASRMGFLLRASHAIPVHTAYHSIIPSVTADIDYVHGEKADAESSVRVA